MSALFLAGVDEATKAIIASGCEGKVFVANDNAPQQLVVAGLLAELDSFEKWVEINLKVRIQRIEVAGPWHTCFIETGKQLFSEWVTDRVLQTPEKTFIMNGPADVVHDAERIRKLITEQLTNPVHWRQSLSRAIELGAREFVEVGPSRVLTGLLRANKLTRQLRFIGSVTSLEECHLFSLTESSQ